MISPAHTNGTAYNVLNMRPLSSAHVSGTAYNLVNMRSIISVNQPDSINLSGLDEIKALLCLRSFHASLIGSSLRGINKTGTITFSGSAARISQINGILPEPVDPPPEAIHTTIFCSIWEIF